MIDAPELLTAPDDNALKQHLADILGAQSLPYWLNRFEGQDVCTVAVASLEDAVRDPHFVERGVFARPTSGSTTT